MNSSPTENKDNPTMLTKEDIDIFIEKLMVQEILTHSCVKCSKEYIHSSYGHHIGECDECWFSRFPKEEVMEFYRSFFR